jgi:hypothetical protein
MSAPAENVVAAPLAAWRLCPQVNLLPEAEQLKLRARQRRHFWIIALVIASAAALLTWQWCSRYEEAVREARASLTEARHRLGQEERQAGALAARAAALRKQQALLARMQTPERWSQRLGEVARALPAQATLTRLHVQAAAGGPAVSPAGNGAGQGPRKSLEVPPAATEIELRLEGMAADHAILATFLRRLQETGAYGRVNLVHSINQAVGNNQALSFGITCRR